MAKPTTFNVNASKPTCNVIIVGAGLSGLAAAIGLRKAGHNVVVLEKMTELREVGAGIQLPANSSRILDSLGVLEKIEACSVQPKQLVIRSYRGAVLSKQQLFPEIKDKFGFPHLLIHRADIRRILYEESLALGAEIHLGAEVMTIDVEKSKVRTTEKDYFGDLIIGADGEHSICRNALLGCSSPPQSSGDLVFRVSIRTALIAQDPDLAELVLPPSVHAWYGPASHAVCYQLQKDSMFNIVLTVPEGSGTVILGPQPVELEDLRSFCNDWDPRFQKLLGLATKALKWTLLQTDDLESWVHPSGRLVLIGDSAHATLPYLAQGAAMALESSFVLSNLLASLEKLSQIPDFLTIYSSIRKPRAQRTKQRSLHMHDTCQMVSGPEQQERDRQLREETPFVGYPNPWADPEFQQWMWGFDAKQQSDTALCDYFGR